ncbi:MAG: ABC transporter substrate-binding protein [Solirubrobacterales bacterium]
MSNDVDAFLLGMEKGFFEKRGINVTLNESKSGGPEIIPALLSNHVQFGYIGVTDLAVAVDKNFKLVGIGPYDVGAKVESEKDAASFAWLKENTEIKSPADLEGKTVAINSLNGLGQMLAEAAVENAGGDPKSIKFVAINFPDMGQALTDGRVDAIWNVEPFLVMLEQEAEIERASSTYPMEPEAPVSVWTVSAEYLEKNEATVKAVQAALNESYEYAAEHEEEDREVVMKATNTEEGLWPKVTLQTHAITVPTSAVETEIEAMEASGLVENPPPLEEWWKSNPLE